MRIFVYECVCGGGLGLDVPASLLREGSAMLSAVVADFQRISGMEVVTLIAEEWSYELGNDCRRPAIAGGVGAFVEIVEVVKSCDWTLMIAPEFDHLLERLSQTVLDVGGKLLGSTPAAIRLTADKLALAELWKARGIRHPWTAAFDPQSVRHVEPPFVLKPRYGAGSQSTHLVRDLKSTPTVKGDEFIVQRFVPGQAASVALLIGETQTIPLCPARQHLSQVGRLRYLGGALPLPPSLADRATRLALEAVDGIDGLHGYVGVDLILGDDGRDHAIEINPRLTTSYMGLRQACESNLAELILSIASGQKTESPAWSAGEFEFRI